MTKDTRMSLTRRQRRLRSWRWRFDKKPWRTSTSRRRHVSMCLSVCPTVFPSHAGILPKRSEVKITRYSAKVTFVSERSRSLYAIARQSVCLSVVCLTVPVTFVHPTAPLRSSLHNLLHVPFTTTAIGLVESLQFLQLQQFGIPSHSVSSNHHLLAPSNVISKLINLPSAASPFSHPATLQRPRLEHHLGLVFMALFSAGSSLTYHLAPFMLNVMKTSLPSTLPLVAFTKGLFSALDLLFVMCTTPLSTLISSLSLDHHLYADDTQLFFSFHPLNFDSSISHLQDALQHISFWMTANLLTLNSSKTEFLLIGLKNQLAKIHHSSLDTSHSAWLHFLWTSYFRWPNYCSLQSLLLSHSSTSLYTAIPWFVNCLYHCYLYHSLQTWLL